MPARRVQHFSRGRGMYVEVAVVTVAAATRPPCRRCYSARCCSSRERGLDRSNADAITGSLYEEWLSSRRLVHLTALSWVVLMFI